VQILLYGGSSANAGNEKNYDSQDQSGQSPFFEGEKIREKGEHQVAWGALVVRIEKRGPLSMGLILLVRGGMMMT
jgi:hypothetical protein